MTSIPNIVEEIIKKKPFLEDALVNGLVNLSALARHLKPEIEKHIDKPVNDSAIIMALNRLIPRIKLVSTMKFRNIVNNIGDIIGRLCICEFIYTVRSSGQIARQGTLYERCFLYFFAGYL